MNDLRLSQAPIAKAEMLIRKPVAEVFEAFVNPAITTKFWFTQSSGRLDEHPQVQWDWEMYKVSVQVRVQAVEPNRRLLIEWGDEPASSTAVEWLFTPQPNGATFVSVTNSGFSGNGDEIVRQALDAVEGFTLVLAGLKALLEHNIALNLVADRFPQEEAE